MLLQQMTWHTHWPRMLCFAGALQLRRPEGLDNVVVGLKVGAFQQVYACRDGSKHLHDSLVSDAHSKCMHSIACWILPGFLSAHLVYRFSDGLWLARQVQDERLAAQASCLPREYRSGHMPACSALNVKLT